MLIKTLLERLKNQSLISYIFLNYVKHVNTADKKAAFAIFSPLYLKCLRSKAIV